MPSRYRLVLVTLTVLALLAPAPVAAAAPAPAAEKAGPPNIVLLVADDQTSSLFTRKLMPTVFRRLADRGVRFDRQYVASALCCPSRTEILTGLTEEHTGVDTNRRKLTVPTIVEAAHDRGYRTALAGKFLNSWPCSKPRRAFDLWMCQGNEKSGHSSVDPTINIDGKWRKLDGVAPQLLANRLSTFIEKTPEDQPFFALYTPTTPHVPADDPRHSSMSVQPHRPPSYNESTEAAGKPAYTHTRPIAPDLAKKLDRTHRKMTRSVRGLDDSIGTILDSLGDRADNTVVMYISDNGYLYGEHRVLGKIHAYEESVRTPFVVRAPQLTSGSRISHALVQNVDVAPTIADLIGFPWRSDGKSLVPLLQRDVDKVRDAALIQHCMGPSYPCGVPRLKYEDGFFLAPSWEGVVERRWKYVEYATGERELYDLAEDPHELGNLAGAASLAAKQRRLAGVLADLTRARSAQTTIVTGPSGRQGVRSVTLTYLSRSSEQRFRCRLTRNGDERRWAECPASGWDIGPLKDGRYRAEVAAIADDGSVDASPAERSFTIERRGPGVKIKARPPAESDNRTARFRLSTGVAKADFECRLVGPGKGGAWRSCGKKVTYRELRHGDYRFYARTVNRAGERTTPPAEDAFAVDRRGPTALFSDRPSNNTASIDASFTFGFDERVEGPVTCRLDEQPAAPCDQREFTATALAPGAHTFTVRAADEHGNKGKTADTWIVDVTAPVVSITAPVGVARETSRAAFSANEAVRRFSCSVDDGPVFNCDPGLMALYGLPPGAHSLQVWATDLAGNVSAPAFTTWWQADSGDLPAVAPGLFNSSAVPLRPVVSLTSAPPARTPSETAVFTFAADRPGTRFSCRIDGSGFAPCTSPAWYEDLPVGQHTFAVLATDAQGRPGRAASATWTVLAGRP